VGCKCYACRKHHRAYVQHLLTAKEMTAWVLLQIHNVKIVSNFFAAIRGSITRGTFEEDCKTFAQTYEEEFPEQTGHGPRLRGYQFKSEGGARKKNPKAFNNPNLNWLENVNLAPLENYKDFTSHSNNLNWLLKENLVPLNN